MLKESRCFPEKKKAWKKGKGDVVYENPKYGKIQAVWSCDEKNNPRYDRILIIEPVGAIGVPINQDNKIGLLSIYREVLKKGKKPSVEPGNLNTNLSDLGRTSIEVPRGYPEKGETYSQTVKRETEEELQAKVIKIKRIGETNPGTAFFPYSLPVFLVRVNSNKEPGNHFPDSDEKIIKVNWYTIKEIKKMIKRKKIFCGFTLAALNFLFQYLDNQV